MASYATGKQTIPAATATKLTLPLGYGCKYLYLQARTAIDIYFGYDNTVTASSATANLIKSGKERVISIAAGDEAWVFITAGGDVDWALNANIE
jgi:hypothetical protein